MHGGFPLRSGCHYEHTLSGEHNQQSHCVCVWDGGEIQLRSRKGKREGAVETEAVASENTASFKKAKKGEKLSPFSLALSAVVHIAMGISLLFWPQKVWKLFIWLLPLFLFATGGIGFLSILGGENGRTRLRVSTAVLYMVFGGIAAEFPWVLTRWLAQCLGIWAVLNGIIRLINGITLLRDQVPGWRRSFFDAVVSFGFGVLFFSNPIGNGVLALLWLGAYLIACGLSVAGDAARAVLCTEYGKKKIRKKVRMALPVLLAAFLPRRLLDSVNASLKVEPPDRPDLALEGQSASHYIEIFIHLKKGIMEGFGHVDLCLDGTVYSYGCYDTASHRLGGVISDGTMAVVPRLPYIRHCLEFEKKKLVGFVVLLTKQEFQDVKGALTSILRDAYSWPCALERRQEERRKREAKQEKWCSGSGGTKNAKERMDAASVLYRRTGAHFLKFKKGKFKTYYVCGTNCVLLADTVMGYAGVDWLRTNGIITPGTYYSYMESLWKLPNSSVIERRIYSRNVTSAQTESEGPTS